MPAAQNLAAAEQLCQELSGQLLQHVTEHDAEAASWHLTHMQLAARVAQLEQQQALHRCAERFVRGHKQQRGAHVWLQVVLTTCKPVSCFTG